MKTIGIVSGMGTKAGLEFLNKFIAKVNAGTDQEFPEFIMHNNSLVPDRTLSILNLGPSPVEELKRSFSLLHESKVDCIVSTCVTSYHFIRQFDDSEYGEIIDPINLIVDKIIADFPQITKIGLLATTGAIKSGMFQRAFENSKVEVITLDESDQEKKLMKSIYMENGFKSSSVSNEAHVLFSEAYEKIVENGAELIVGACTEVQFGMTKMNVTLPYIDIVDVMVDKIIDLTNEKN